LRILAIESSCDESAAAVLDAQHGLLAHDLFSQVELHRVYGGVVPEIASRDHVRKLLPLVDGVLAEAAARAPRPAAGAPVDGIAFTTGPGLVGALLTGAALGRSLALGWGVPALGVHHLEGHLLAPRLEPDPPPFPHVSLLVSGGHTMLIEARALGDYRLLGQTRDDAAGEAFDKTAKLLGLPYPGGPHLARLAAEGRERGLRFPRPMRAHDSLEFSFSGLKTAVQLALERDAALPAADVAREVQEAIVDVLVEKSVAALEQTGHDLLVAAGGVAANRRLRERLDAAARVRGARVYYPCLEFCTDNAAMIAVAGLARLAAGEHDDLTIAARAQWPLTSLRPPVSRGDTRAATKDPSSK
jgi:N6-L-threonylcarbamoyladenine synthase